MKIEKKWLSAIILPIVLGIVIILQPPVFYLNDDVTMRSILSGAYTGVADGHAVYMQYPLTGILALLYRIAGFVPWLELFFTACIAICMILLAEQFKQPIIGGLLAIVWYVPFCLYMHYTLVAAVVAGTAVFLLTRGKRNAWPIVLILLAYMIRGQVGLLCLPFVAGAMVWQVIITEKRDWKREIASLLKYSVALIVGLLVCFLINSICYSAPEWKSYLEYNESRTLLYDYTDFLSTDFYAENYTSYNMTEEEYRILSSYDTMLDAGIDEVKMEEVAEAVSSGMKQDVEFAQMLKDSIQKYYLQIRYGDVPYNYIWIAACLLLAVAFIFSKKWLPLCVLGVLITGRSSIWMYLIWQGRFPERVSLSLYSMELMILLGMGVWFVQGVEFRHMRVKRIAVVAMILGLVGAGCYWWNVTTVKVQQQAEVQNEWTVLKEYCAENVDRLYLVDVFSAVEYADLQYTADADNIMLLGGWMSASPLAGERFARVDAWDAAEALFAREEVSLIADKDVDVSWLEEYLQSRFGECGLEAVAEISGGDRKSFVEYRVNRP